MSSVKIRVLFNNKISISGNFDGGNPKDPNNIIQTAPNSFTIIPFSEDNDPNYKFRLDAKIINRSAVTRKVKIHIQWQEDTYNTLRDYVFLKNAKSDWRYLPAHLNGTESVIELDFPPGETYLCLHPKYNYQDYVDFVSSVPESELIKKTLVGRTAEGRELWMIKLSTKQSPAKKKILLTARIHPYETAGSYCIEGIVDYFTNHNSPFKTQNSKLKIALSPFTFYLIPMANPDGVFHGLCKKTAITGIDLAKEMNSSEPTWAALKEVIDAVRPHIYCEIHNWMHKDSDGIYFLNWLQAKRFVKNMPSQESFGKRWRTMLRKKLFAISPLGFKKYCKEEFGSTCLCLEYPWFGRTVEDMKKLGIDTLMALTKM